jgi:hypothetical protein
MELPKRKPDAIHLRHDGSTIYIGLQFGNDTYNFQGPLVSSSFIFRENDGIVDVDMDFNNLKFVNKISMDMMRKSK